MVTWFTESAHTFLWKPTTAQRCRSETEKNIFNDIFSLALSQFKKHNSSGNLKFNNLGIPKA